MRISSILTAIGLGFVAFVLIWGYFYLGLKGKEIVLEKIDQQVDRKVTLGNVNVRFPFVVAIRDVTVEGLGSAREIDFTLSFGALFKKEVRFSQLKIIAPRFVLVKGEENAISFGEKTEKEDAFRSAAREAFLAPPTSKSRKDFHFFAKSLVMEKGLMDFVEETPEGPRTLFTLKDLEMRVRDISLPSQRPLKTDINATALLTGFDGLFKDDKTYFSGWADFFQKDMGAKVRIVMKSGQARMEADVTSVKNDMTVQGTMNLAFKGREEKEGKKESLEDFFVEALKATGSSVDARFSFTTKMDDFRVGKISLSGQIMQEDESSESVPASVKGE